MPLILGIDPGLQHTGWGIIRANGNQLSYMACGVISSNAKEEMAERLRTLYDGITDVIARYQPEQVAIEETFINKNPLSSLKLGHARGALMLAVSLAGLRPYEYAATLVKKSLVGAGRAEKHQVEMMVKHLLGGAAITGADAADALAVAICHASHASLNAQMKRHLSQGAT